MNRLSRTSFIPLYLFFGLLFLGLRPPLKGQDCMDLGGLDFGLCEMAMGVALIDGECTGLSGCGWTIDGVDYSAYGFESVEACISACGTAQCLDLDGLDFGLCDLFLGYALVGNSCMGLSGCGWEVDGVDYSPYFFNELTACQSACENPMPDCMDLEDIDFGLCDLFLGYALVGNSCMGLSGCGWEVDGVDYSPYFFNELTACQSACENPMPDCMDLEGVDFGDCDLFLGYALVGNSCMGLSGCGWEVDGVDYSPYFFNELTACQSACENPMPDCLDLEGVDFGDCDLFLGYALVGNSCMGLSGCGWEVDGVDYSPYFFESLPACELTCASEEPDCLELGGLDFGDCELYLGIALINGQCTAMSGCGWEVDGIDYSPYFYDDYIDCVFNCSSDPDACYQGDILNTDDIECTEIEDPVCGCDGETYPNACYALKFGGIVSYEPGPCDTSIEEQERSWRIYPNPHHGIVRFDLPADFVLPIYLLELGVDGRLLQERQITERNGIQNLHSGSTGLSLLILRDSEGRQLVRRMHYQKD